MPLCAAVLLASPPVFAATSTWTGGSSTGNNFSDSANWGGTALASGNSLLFAGSTRLTPNNDLTGLTIGGIYFDPAAGAFTLGGNAITNTGNIVFYGNNNPSTLITQAVNLNLVISNSCNINSQSNGTLVVSGTISAYPGNYSASSIFKDNPGHVVFSGPAINVNAVNVRQGYIDFGANDFHLNSLYLNPATGMTPPTQPISQADLRGSTQTVTNLSFGANLGAFNTPINLVDSVGGGVLKLAGNVTYLGGLSINYSNSQATISAALDLNGADRTFGIQDSAATSVDMLVNGAIINSVGTGGIIKNNTGVLVLAGANSYNGNTTVNGGTLQLNVACLNPAAYVSVANIGTANNPLLKLNFTGTNPVAAFYTNFVALPDGIYNAANLPGVISGSGALQVGAVTPTVTPTVTASWLGGSRFTYNGSGQGPTLGSVVTSPHSPGTTNISYVGVSGTTYGPSANPPTSAGNYQVTVTIGASGNFTSATSSPYSFIIQSIADNSVSVYPSVPGLPASDQYAVRVCAATNGANWQSAFAWETACGTNYGSDTPQIDSYFSSLTGWTHTYVNFVATTPVIVEISKVDGSAITKAAVHPARMGSVTVANGKAYVTLNTNCNVAVDINGQMDDNDTGFVVTNPNNSNIGHYWQGAPINTISLHDNPPLAGVPATNDPSVYLVAPGSTPPSTGSWTTLYFLPGVHNIGIGFPIHKNKSYYIPGDALVYGSFCNYTNWNDGSNILIFGHGTLSETPWHNPRFIAGVTNVNWYHPIEISGALNTSVEGISIADPCYHSVMMYAAYTPGQYTLTSWVKVFGWRGNGDGYNPFGNGTISNCFLRTQDDSCYVRGVGISDLVLWNDANGSSFVLTGLPNLTNQTLLVHDCDVIYQRAFWINWSGSRVFNMRGVGSGACGSGVIFSNINVEDPRPTAQIFGCWMALASPYGSGSRDAGDWSGTFFKNVSIAAANGNYEPEILWGTNNAQIHDLTFDNLTVGGITVLTNIFKTNAYVYNLRFTNSTPRVISGMTANAGSFSFNLTNNGSYVGLPGTNGASIFAVTNNGAYVVQASSSLANPNGWIPIATNVAPFAFTDTNVMAAYPQRVYRVLSP
jgi:autotransporter-associated beta strand protein